MLIYPDRDVTRNTQSAGFMIILFSRPFFNAIMKPVPLEYKLEYYYA